MSQPLRPNPPGWFHVMNRGARRWDIFHDDEDRRFFLRLLSGLRKRFEVRVVSYCLMENHFHLVLHCPEPALSRAMQWLASRYTKQFNKRHGYDGPLCRSRFHSVEVLDDQQLATVVRYVHRNPLAMSSALDLSSYEWSSHGAYVGAIAGPGWLDTEVPLKLFGGSRQAFARMVETALPFDAVQNRPSLTVVKKRVRSNSSKPTVATIERAVAVVGQCRRREVREFSPGQAKPMFDAMLSIVLARCDLDLDELVDEFHFASLGSLRGAIARVERKLVDDDGFADLVADVCAVLDRAAESKAA